MTRRRRFGALIPVVLLVAGACGGGAATSPTTSVAPPPVASPTAASASPSATADSDDLLAKVKDAGKIVISTDSNYEPQSFQNPDGTFEGFDIDVGTEIAERLGVDAEFSAQIFDAVVAGSWSGRWDMSVGSITVLPQRQEILDFTQAYYFTPVDVAATEASGITTLDGLAGKKICVGSSTTYQYWLDGTLELLNAPEPTPPPDGAEAFPLETDQLCAQTAASRRDFDGFASSSTTIAAAIDDGAPLVVVAESVFFEELSVAFDKSEPNHDELLAEVDRIIGEMHEDGTLTELSEKWFDGEDLTKPTE
jgi:polar amino acid transport system substrate-binding protein